MKNMSKKQRGWLGSLIIALVSILSGKCDTKIPELVLFCGVLFQTNDQKDNLSMYTVQFWDFFGQHSASAMFQL